jgi:hypothetical protein
MHMRRIIPCSQDADQGYRHKLKLPNVERQKDVLFLDSTIIDDFHHIKSFVAP